MNHLLESLDIPVLWKHTLGDPSVRVAFIDGPVLAEHAAFQGAALDLLPGTAPSKDGAMHHLGHGSHVVSIVLGQHSWEIKGIAPFCTGIIIPVFGSSDEYSCSQVDLARAIVQAINSRAHIINISGGQYDPSGDPDPLLRDALAECEAQGVLVIAAAGNDGCSCVHVPASVPTVIAVGALGQDGQPLPTSNWGEPYLRNGLLAPGENVPGAGLEGIQYGSGTSYAAPIVTGTAALLLHIIMQSAEVADTRLVRQALYAGARKCSPLTDGDCDRFMVGALDPRCSLDIVLRGLASRLVDPLRPSVSRSREVCPDNIAPTCPTTTSTQPMEVTTVSGTPIIHADAVDLSAEKPVERTGAHAQPLSDVTRREPSRLTLSDCGCGGGKGECSCQDSTPKQRIYALGELGYDFGSEARRDYFTQQVGRGDSPSDPEVMINLLREYPYLATSLIWTLSLDETPIYSIVPATTFGEEMYRHLINCLESQAAGEAERVSLPGIAVGTQRLLNGSAVEVVAAERRGIHAWSTTLLIESILGPEPEDEEQSKVFEAEHRRLREFLDKVYYELRNLGQLPSERALNYAATNTFQARDVLHRAATDGLELDRVQTERSSICRPGSDCWDVKMIFFNPKNRTEQARRVACFTVDVSDVVPVGVGKLRTWTMY